MTNNRTVAWALRTLLLAVAPLYFVMRWAVRTIEQLDIYSHQLLHARDEKTESRANSSGAVDSVPMRTAGRVSLDDDSHFETPARHARGYRRAAP